MFGGTVYPSCFFLLTSMWCENTMRLVRYCGGAFCYHHFLVPWSWIVMLIRYSQPQPWDQDMEGSFKFSEFVNMFILFLLYTTWGVSRYLISHTLPVWPSRLSPLTLEVAGEFDDIPANKFAQCSGGRASPISHPGKNLCIFFFEVSSGSLASWNMVKTWWWYCDIAGLCWVYRYTVYHDSAMYVIIYTVHIFSSFAHSAYTVLKISTTRRHGVPQYFRGSKANHSFGAECREIFTRVNLSTPTVQVVVVVLFFFLMIHEFMASKSSKKNSWFAISRGLFVGKTHTHTHTHAFAGHSLRFPWILSSSRFVEKLSGAQSATWLMHWACISCSCLILLIFRLKTYLGKAHHFLFVKFKLNSKWWF